jgi:hypothetical protein
MAAVSGRALIAATALSAHAVNSAIALVRERYGCSAVRLGEAGIRYRPGEFADAPALYLPTSDVGQRPLRTAYSSTPTSLYSGAYLENSGFSQLWKLEDIELLSATYAIAEARRNLALDRSSG